ncbi:MAG: DUF554 domain-containing protein [Lachnospiraceae bacterium]|nr:DUF554 domain-containing protein [Lachnospiraceae bacterium]
MIGLGTIINVAGVIVGGLVGMLFGKLITPRFQDTLMKANGLCVLFLGIAGVLEKMFTIQDGQISSTGTMMMISSLAVGSLIGEWINLEYRMQQFGQWLKIKTGNAKDRSFVDGFVTASLTVCIGAMAIVGALQDGLTGNYSTLLTKAILDLIIVCVMTASLGKGCMFSAIPIAILQGSVTLLARAIAPIMTETALSNLSLVGNILIFCVGANLVWDNLKIKVANMLPAIVIAVAWAFLP